VSSLSFIPAAVDGEPVRMRVYEKFWFGAGYSDLYTEIELPKELKSVPPAVGRASRSMLGPAVASKALN
jgi:hypothetical protein